MSPQSPSELPASQLTPPATPATPPLRASVHSKLIEMPGRGSAVDEVLDWILNHLRREGYEIGSILPTETEICNQTGISRNSVREATSYLRALGIVESRQRVGMRLKRDPSLIGLQRLLTCSRVPPLLFRDVSSYRDGLEIGMAHEVIENITDEEIDRLQQYVDEISNSADDIQAQYRNERNFHTSFLLASRNEIVKAMSHILDPLFAFMEADYEPSMPSPYKTLAIHQKIVNALRKRDESALIKALVEHAKFAGRVHYRE